ncbi:MAG: ATP-binding cassette domain-containing protein [Acidimicrobiales bacterium]
MEEPVIETRGISKHYGQVQALSDVSLSVRPGEVVALVGDNGAGKSTLVNILSGALPPSSGSILVGGRDATLASPLDARRQGIETVYQDLALAPHLPVWANLFLGREQKVRGPLGWVGWLDKKGMARRTEEELVRTRIRMASVETTCDSLSGGQRQAVAVAKAVAWGSRILLMDEPTAALGVEQQEKVADLVRTVRDRGIPVLIISHNLPQVHSLCDRILVLFHGQLVADLPAAGTSIEETVLWITGGALTREGHGR